MKSLTLILFLFLAGCQLKNNTDDNIKMSDVRINTKVEFQTIHNFGASDAWSCQHVGNWPDEQKNKIADLLFSLQEKEDGLPAGIGLSCWRFNIGGGSADQEGDTKISDPWREAECFLQKDGTYDWNKQKGQRWFLHAAKNRGIEYFIGFVNSPPVWLTKNKRANSDEGNSTNLKAGNFDQYSKFLIDVTQNIQKNEGVLFNYLSPVNEPQWGWENGQEGSPWTNSEISRICQIIGNDLKKAGLSTKIEISEAGQLNHLYAKANDVERGFQIKEFFSPESENYVGNLPNMAHKIAGHSYFTTTNDSVLKAVRSKVRREIEKVDPQLEFWMSEFCVLGDNNGFTGNGRDLGMETALFVANVIHSDLTIANASAWHWWLAVSPYDFKDGLVYIDKNETGGNIYESKLLWALGNYSRFIRPGAKRVSVKSAKNLNLKISAYKNTDNQVVVVCINRGEEAASIQFDLAGEAKIYETSEEQNLSLMGKHNLNKAVLLSGRSITTLVI
ncbi:glycoside hydrolase family 30 protein [Draconibacterium halophilum]|uniref:Glycoside hydrolase family 30 protein n=1 Tax=Draconibacterium halophilum TaxID=2706887 RepID=A0A6C0R7N7_9BACT|nr:glycoside hydrolase family 30 protein [Draconibacterium halophilum]QIA06288.1 glycoside hydrolase family 30 protein [Draconibacterium halophilum]